jgi:hypothetical protein
MYMPCIVPSGGAIQSVEAGADRSVCVGNLLDLTASDSIRIESEEPKVRDVTLRISLRFVFRAALMG